MRTVLAGLAVVCTLVGQTPAKKFRTPWGDPDLQGAWSNATTTPLQRPAKYASQEIFTEAQRAELDKARAAMITRDRRSERGTERAHQLLF